MCCTVQDIYTVCVVCVLIVMIVSVAIAARDMIVFEMQNKLHDLMSAKHVKNESKVVDAQT